MKSYALSLLCYRVLVITVLWSQLLACAPPEADVTNTNDNRYGIALPGRFLTVDLPPGTLFAYLYLDQEEDTPLTSTPVDYQNGQATVKFDKVTVPSGRHTFTIRFMFQAPNVAQLEIANASSPVYDLQPGGSTPIGFTENNYIYDADADGDGITNIKELEARTDPWNTDVDPPSVQNLIPPQNATDVPLNVTISAELSETLKSSSINQGSIVLTGPGSTIIDGTTIQSSPRVISYTPTSALLPNTSYTVSLSSEIRDSVGNKLTNEYIWSFTTGNGGVPQAYNPYPGDGSNSALLYTEIKLDFSEVLDTNSVTSDSFTVRDGTGSPVSGNLMISNTPPYRITFTPSTSFTMGASYSVAASTAITDIDGVPLGNQFSWSFTTTSQDHSNIANNCVSCHNGTDATGLISGHLATVQDCALCHTTFNFRDAFIHHSGPEVAAIRCDSCHNGTKALGKNTGHISTTSDCGVCHTTLTFLGSLFDHASVAGSRCDVCHNGADALGKGVNHLVTTEDCAVCHVTGTFVLIP